MEKGYLAAAWGDLVRSPGFFGKLLRLSLVMFIPVFGAVVNYGYLYGWAREIAWNVHRPLPDRIFGNEDGTLYKRGLFIVVLGAVCAIVPAVFSSIVSLFSFGMVDVLPSHGSFESFGLIGALGMGFGLNVLSVALSFAALFFLWVGSMRMAVYTTLSSGFQLSKIWAMLRYDFPGLLRIFGMSLALGAIAICVVFVVVGVAVLIGIVLVSALAYVGVPDFMIVLVCLAGVFLLCWLVLLCSVVTETLTARALGYWTRQFQVSQWGGQEDPLPFERQAASL